MILNLPQKPVTTVLPQLLLVKVEHVLMALIL